MPISNLALCLAGFILLALSMNRHFEVVFGGPVTAPFSLAFRVTGWVILALAATQSIQQEGTSIGLAMWVGELGVAAMLVALLLTYGSRRLVLSAGALALLAALML